MIQSLSTGKRLHLRQQANTMAKPTPVLVPASPDFPLDDTLRRDLQNALTRENTVPLISTALNVECEKAGWQDALKARVIQMLKSGEFENRQELVGAIVREARGLCVEENEAGEAPFSGKGKGSKENKGIGKKGDPRREKAVDIRIPQNAIAEGVAAVRNTLDKFIEIEPEKGFWD